MPHLVQMNKRYGKKGLQIIGVHRQNASEEEIIKMVEKLEMEFPVAKSGSGPVETRGIPHLFIFSTAGKLVFSGHPMDDEAEKIIKRELKSATADEKKERKFGLIERPKNLTPVRTWTNTEGKTVRAALVSVSGDKAKLQLTNGKQVDYAIDKLSEEDQKLIQSKAGESP